MKLNLSVKKNIYYILKLNTNIKEFALIYLCFYATFYLLFNNKKI